MICQFDSKVVPQASPVELFVTLTTSEVQKKLSLRRKSAVGWGNTQICCVMESIPHSLALKRVMSYTPGVSKETSSCSEPLCQK